MAVTRNRDRCIVMIDEENKYFKIHHRFGKFKYEYCCWEMRVITNKWGVVCESESDEAVVMVLGKKIFMLLMTTSKLNFSAGFSIMGMHELMQMLTTFSIQIGFVQATAS